MNDAKDCTAFVDFLKDREGLEASDIPPTSDWAGAGNTVGSIGLRIGLLSLDQIDQIISKQSSDTRLFGEIAIASKFLAQEQVDLLLTLQRFHRCLDMGAVLVAERRLSFSALLEAMAGYFRKEEARGIGPGSER